MYFLDIGLLDSDQFRAVWKSMEGQKLHEETIDRAFYENIVKNFRFQKYNAAQVLAFAS